MFSVFGFSVFKVLRFLSKNLLMSPRGSTTCRFPLYNKNADSQASQIEWRPDGRLLLKAALPVGTPTSVSHAVLFLHTALSLSAPFWLSQEVRMYLSYTSLLEFARCFCLSFPIFEIFEIPYLRKPDKVNIYFKFSAAFSNRLIACTLSLHYACIILLKRGGFLWRTKIRKTLTRC